MTKNKWKLQIFVSKNYIKKFWKKDKYFRSGTLSALAKMTFIIFWRERSGTCWIFKQNIFLWKIDCNLSKAYKAFAFESDYVIFYCSPRMLSFWLSQHFAKIYQFFCLKNASVRYFHHLNSFATEFTLCFYINIFKKNIYKCKNSS